MKITPTTPFLTVLVLSLLCGISTKAQGVSQVAELVESNGAKNDFFGGAVAISGNTLVVGAPGVVKNGREFGAVYVFQNDGGGWAQVAELAETEKTGLGIPVAISGDGGTVVAGNGDGRVFVFVEPPAGWTNMTQTAELQPNGLGFGTSVAITADGKIVAVGGLNNAAV